jgi:hypothetical protein
MKIIRSIIMASIIICLPFGSVISSTPMGSSDDRAGYFVSEYHNNNERLDPKVIKIIDSINETLLKTFLEGLVSIGPRMTGTYGCEKASEYIIDQFNDMGLDTIKHPWESWGNRYNFRFFNSENIIATQQGTGSFSDEVIIFNAHYDTVRNSPGANDDGSGVVAVLAAAYVLNQHEFDRTIKYVTFSGEEIGLRGSHAFVRDLYDEEGDVLVEFNVDMVGRATSKETGRAMRMSVTEDVDWIIDIIEDISQKTKMDFSITTYDVNRFSAGGSDYAEFAQFGYETIAFWQAEHDPYMHTPEDTIDKINFSYLTNYTKHIVGTIASIADADINQPRIQIANPKRGKRYVEDLVRSETNDHISIVFGKSLITAEVIEGLHPVDHVKFYLNDKLMHIAENAPYQWWLNRISLRRTHDIKAVVVDSNANTAEDEIRIVHTNFFRRW